MRVVVTGATGFLGSALVPVLRERGDDVVVLSRDAARAKSSLGDVEAVTADLENPGAWTAALAGAGVIVHLAGEPIAGKRWDARQKQKIRDSRVESTRVIVEAIAALPASERPRVLITASGIDFYPVAPDTDYDDDEVTEIDPPSESFLGRVCRDWEREAKAAEPLSLRVVALRIGLVLGPGGALAKMTRPFVASRLGHGRQWVSWMHRDDAVAAAVAAVHDERYRGPINLVTDSIRNAQFMRAVGKALGRASLLRVPGFVLRAAVGGELAESILNGRRVVPARLRELGFAWKHPKLSGALAAAR